MRVLALALLVAACASIQPVAYTPNPQRIANPRDEIATLIKANVTSGCIAEPTFEGKLLQVKFVCQNGIGNTVSRLDRIASVKLEQYQEWYRCTVHHTQGDDFTWTSKSLEDMQRLADAFSALSGAPAPTRDTSSL